MYRNDHPTAGPNGEFLSEVAPGQPATRWPAEHMTEINEEVCNAIEGFGIALQKGVRNQLFQAMQSALGPAPAGVKNALINGSFEVAQFGSFGTASGVANAITIGVDRWRINPGGAGGSVQYSTPAFSGAAGEPPGNPKRYLRLQILGTEPSQGPRLVQRVENVLTLAGSPAVFSFYARCTAGTVLAQGNIIQNFGSGGSASPNQATGGSSVLIDTTWKFFTVTFNVPTVAGKTISGGDSYLNVQLNLPGTGTYTVEFADVQFERGSSATSFERRTFADELLRCMRYRESSLPYGLAAPNIGGGGLEDPLAAAKKGYQPTPVTGVAPFETWQIWSLGQPFRVPKRAASGGSTTYLVWHNNLSNPTANSVVVGGTVRAVTSTINSSNAHTGTPVLSVNPGAGPQVCEGHWVWDDPTI